ncbi:MAG TPA: 2-oxoacid:ferredoxin oxidoreductase subunit beta, partial [Actinomycetota bacterium]|nr:2-oxoacid:ferredoxin oxidoreductase subunit beta [Actinomycetota bacterium]
YNDGAFIGLTGKEGKAHNRIYLEHGRPIRYGPQGEHGLVAGPNGSLRIEDVAAVGEDKLVVHDERRTDPSYAFALSRLAGDPAGPTALGVFRDVDAPVYGEGVEDQIRRAVDSSGPGDLNKLLFSGDTWTVR